MDKQKLEIKIKKKLVKEHVFFFVIEENIRDHSFLSIGYRYDEVKNKHSSDGFFGAQSFDEDKNVIMFHVAVEIDNKKIDGVSIPEPYAKQIRELKERAVENKEKEQKRIYNFVPKKLRWATGGDTHRIYITTDEIDTVLQEPKVLQKVKELIERVRGIEKILRKHSKKIDLETGMYTLDGWYEIETKYLIKPLENYHKKIAATFEAKENRIEELKKKAKETGEKQELSRYTVECNDEYEECSVDIIITYILPGGEEKTARIHTY